MPTLDGQNILPGVYSQIQPNLLPTGAAGLRVPAFIGTGRLTNLVSNFPVVRGGTSTDAISPNPPTAIDGNIQDANFVIYQNGLDFVVDSGVGVTWQTSAAFVVGTTLSSTYTSALVGETFILAIANGPLHSYTFALVDFKDANDTTASVPFAITSVTDGTHLVVSSTAGMSATDTITQGVATTTITTVVDGTHLTVGNTSGFVSSYNVTNVVAALNADFTTNSIAAVASNSSNHLKIATVATSDSSLYIGTGTSNGILGFTAGSFQQTPQAPLAGVTYYVTYEYPKVTADYIPKFYFTLQAVTNDYGPVQDSTSIPTAASLAFQNGAAVVCICQENPADGSPVAQVQSALNKLLATQNISIVVSLEGTSNPQLIAAIKQHVDIASSTINRLERTAIIGYEGSFTDQNMLDFALAASDKRIVSINQSGTTNTMIIGTDADASVVGGQYLAAALAGVRCNPAFDVAQPMTREIISGIATSNTLTQAEKSLLVNQGVCIIDNVSGVPKVLFGTSTDFSTVANQLFQVTQIMDYVAQTLRGLLDPIFIGQKLLSTTPSQVQTVTAATLTTIQNATIIVSFTPPQATIDPDVPTQIDLQVGVQPTLEVDVIFITLGLNLI